MNISMPESMRSWVEKQVDEGGYGSVSEFFRHLLREAKKRQELRESIDARLLDALDSGKSTPMTKKDWQDIRRAGAKRIAARKSK